MKGFKYELLKNLSIPESKKEFLPAGFQRIGNVVILSLHEEVMEYRKEIGEFILKRFPYVRSVYLKKSPITGELRLPKLQWICGDKNPVTVHKENKCVFKLDVTKVMFAKGNLRERGRIPKLVKRNEVIVDMFAGIGYFSIPIGKHSKAKRVYAIEKNPTAFGFLKENIKLNSVEKKVIPIYGDNRKVELPEKAERVIMGYLPDAKKFLPYAFRFLKNKGIIHYHGIYSKNEIEKSRMVLEKISQKQGYSLERILYQSKVKSYAPGIYHMVTDAEFRKIKFSEE